MVFFQPLQTDQFALQNGINGKGRQNGYGQQEKEWPNP
jgi:hypothetical protein